MNGKLTAAGGSKGRIIVSNDHGKIWNVSNQNEQKDYRGIQILNKSTIVAMSSGEGVAEVIKSQDKGKTWQTIFETKEPSVFLDCIKFKNKKRGFILGDVIQKNIYLLGTKNGGKTWKKIDLGIPAVEGEASYAASNSSIVLNQKKIWLCTQNRVFYSKNNGKKWHVFDTPFDKNDMRGIYGLYLIDHKKIIAHGGDYNGQRVAPLFANSIDGGKNWQLDAENERLHTIECIAHYRDETLIAVGTAGIYRSNNNGKDWKKISDEVFHAVLCKNGQCMAAGKSGIVKININ